VYLTILKPTNWIIICWNTVYWITVVPPSLTFYKTFCMLELLTLVKKTFKVSLSNNVFNIVLWCVCEWSFFAFGISKNTWYKCFELLHIHCPYEGRKLFQNISQNNFFPWFEILKIVIIIDRLFIYSFYYLVD